MTIAQNDLSNDRQIIIDYMLNEDTFNSNDIDRVRCGVNSEDLIVQAFAAYIQAQSLRDSLEPIDTAPAALYDETS